MPIEDRNHSWIHYRAGSAYNHSVSMYASITRRKRSGRAVFCLSVQYVHPVGERGAAQEMMTMFLSLTDAKRLYDAMGPLIEKGLAHEVMAALDGRRK